MDKEAIEAIAKYLAPLEWSHIPDNQDHVAEDCKEYTKSDYLEQAQDIFNILTSLGYVKMVEQKLPENPYDKNNQFHNWQTWNHGTQDMLSVDSEGCKWVRVRVK